MALTLVAETGAVVANANSYATAAQARSYALGRLYSEDMQNVTQSTLEAALVWATRLLDTQVRWNGIKYDQNQALEWPRVGVYDKSGFLYDFDEIPQWLIDAVCELSLFLLKEDRTADQDTYGFSRMKVADLEIDIDKFDRRNVLPDSVIAMVRPFGVVAGAPSVKLLRA